MIGQPVDVLIEPIAKADPDYCNRLGMKGAAGPQRHCS
jgi:hypothetical protein